MDQMPECIHSPNTQVTYRADYISDSCHIHSRKWLQIQQMVIRVMAYMKSNAATKGTCENMLNPVEPMQHNFLISQFLCYLILCVFE